MKLFIIPLTAVLSLTAGATVAATQGDKPYREGPVTEVSYIRVKDGKMFDYIAYLRGTWTQEHEAEKKAGLISDYRIYEAAPRSPEEANLILTVTYPNYSALDRTNEFDAIAAKTEGSLKEADKGYGDRGTMRTVIGSELVRELVLK